VTDTAKVGAPATSRLQVAEAARIMSQAVEDKTYQLFPLGQEAAVYLRVRRKGIADSTYRDVESCLDKFARHFMHLELADFEPPLGAERLEEFLEHQWGPPDSPRTYNKNLSYMRKFFEFQIRRGKMKGDPTSIIDRSKTSQVYRTTFSPDQRRAIVAEQTDLRHKIALRLLLDYALRKGSLRAVQFKHFDHVRKRLTIFAKGGKVRAVPIPDPAFWHDLERLILDSEAEPGHYLMQRMKGNGKVRAQSPTSRWASTGCTTGGTAA
jgi:site-specific recombinase XerC